MKTKIVDQATGETLCELWPDDALLPLVVGDYVMDEEQTYTVSKRLFVTDENRMTIYVTHL